MNRQFAVGEGAAGRRLDLYLATELGQTRSHIQRLVRHGNVLVNGNPTKVAYLTEPKDQITITVPDTTRVNQEPPELNIVYEDDDILVVDKPPHVTTHHGAGTTGPAVSDFARPRTTDPDPDRPGIVHRLDRDTSGLLIIAKSPESKNYMQKLFADHKVKKTYLALTTGRVQPPDAVIRLPLDRDQAHPLKRAVVPGGRQAITRYRTLANFPGFTLLEATPETGRTHQIRVHLASLGHAIAGDTVYGPPHRPLGLARQFLHAGALEFKAPSGQELKLTSPLPPDLASVLAALGGSGII